ncbi:Putative U-box domain-containing protein 53 [Apostasia shenzhenica]|uniref:RING-type E3 ubiquitin transferase n=1 Tax=Apostasia shenzhenica TaxID=1088818 RepID=A0A2H9ZZP2_9ASPA|nr:Putative U-box domain-containing protein 53 [Apostasia shenzhenica]
MENGSLDDRLHCRDNSPPLPWAQRLKIAWEVASALVFLHHSSPPIIHRDLKPANILLDANFRSKIGDVGLSTLLPSTKLSLLTLCKDTAPVGTFFFIDPEYQRTGLVSPKSDTYALGVVILQLLTGKQPMGLAYSVETAMEDGVLMEILDDKAGKWPEEVAKDLAVLGLRCVELRRKDRPDLKGHVLPALERLKEIAEKGLRI